MMTIEERQEAAKWFQNRAIHTTMPGAKMMFKRAAEALSEGIQPQRQAQACGKRPAAIVQRQAENDKYTEMIQLPLFHGFSSAHTLSE